MGLADEEYAHEGGMITSSEVRAVALSKLHVAPGVMWDIGAASGSVGLEAGALCDQLTVYAIEQKENRARHIRQNAARVGVAAQVINKNALDAMAELPPPRCVFLGGGGAQVGEILTAAFECLCPGGRIVAAAVMQETEAQLTATHPLYRTEIVDVSVHHAKQTRAGTRMVPANPVKLYCFQKGE